MTTNEILSIIFIRHCFSLNRGYSGIGGATVRSSGDSTFGVICNVDKHKEFFVPSVILPDKYRLPYDSDTTVIRPLFITSQYSSSTTLPAIKSLLSSSPTSLVKAIVKNDNVYFGSKGILLDSNMDILMLCGIYCSFIDDNSSQSILGLDCPKHRVQFNTPTVYIHNRVFRNNDPISKYIANTIIPFYSKVSPITVCDKNFTDLSLGIRIIVEDIDHMIVKPKAPTCIDFNSKIFNNLNEECISLLL